MKTTEAAEHAVVEMPQAAQPADDVVVADAEPVGRFRRRMERFKGMADSQELPGSLDDEAELKLQLMLLREENARLKAARHQPPSSGTAIDRVRVLTASVADVDQADQVDDVWSLLADCMAIREGLDQACREISLAVDAVRDRLEAIAQRVDHSLSVNGGVGDDEGIRSA